MGPKILALKAGKNLKNLISKSKWKTQERFANEAMHVDPVTVRRWISKGIDRLSTLEEIASKLGIDFLDLLK